MTVPECRSAGDAGYFIIFHEWQFGNVRGGKPPRSPLPSLFSAQGSLMPSIDFNAIRDMIPVPTLLHLWRWRETKADRNGLRGPCPVHGSKNPKSRSFCCNNSQWHCFSCRRSGDVTDLYAALTGKPLLTAAYELCLTMGLKPPFLPRKSRYLRRT